MAFEHWLSLLGICFLGASLPGASLAVVMQNTLRGGVQQGVVTALSHAVGVGLYAVLTIVGLAVVIKTTPLLFNTIQLAGALFLIYFGVKSFWEAGADKALEVTMQTTRKSLSSGFMIAFLNPKLAIFFTALFSQFIYEGSTLLHKGIMVVTAAGVDAAWYVVVVVLITKNKSTQNLLVNTKVIGRVFGVLLVGLGLKLLMGF